MLEDESARVALCGDALPAGACVTGVVAAVRGRVLPSGDFHVTAVTYAGMAPQPPLPADRPDRWVGGGAAVVSGPQEEGAAVAGGGASHITPLPSQLHAPPLRACCPTPAARPPRPPRSYVALVSGLGVGDEEGDPLRLQLLVDYLAGALGAGQDQSVAARVARVVVAGGLLKSTAELSQPTAYTSLRQQASALGPVRCGGREGGRAELCCPRPPRTAALHSQAVLAVPAGSLTRARPVPLSRDLDMSLTELASAVPLDLMPGAGDPSNYSLPQQPLHRCLLPGAAAYASVVRATNPHAFTVAGVSFLGTSGQNVDDIHRYSDLDSRDLILERLLAWRHLAPTAPDTLAAYPYFDADPFIMDATPHVLFAGGQPEFGTRLVAGPGGAGPGVRVVAVPDFNATGCLVLLNLATLQCHPLYFDVGAAA